MQRLATARGATLLGSTAVTGVEDHGSHLVVGTPGSSYTCRGVVICADAWTNQVLARLGVEIPLTVTLEQATYFEPADPGPFADLPLWIWMDEPSYYGFPCYGAPTIKAAQDCGGPVVDPDHRTSDADPRCWTSTFHSFPWHGITSPAERFEANRRSEANGNFRSSSISSVSFQPPPWHRGWPPHNLISFST